MTFLEKAEGYLAKPGRLSRRSFFGRSVQISAAAAGLAAGIMPLDQALAQGCTGYQSGTIDCGGYTNVECCCLAAPTNFCSSNYYSQQCPAQTKSCSGCGQPWEWTCKMGTCPWVCGECYCSGCSYAYALCAPGCPCTPEAPTLEAKLYSMRSARQAAAAHVSG